MKLTDREEKDFRDMIIACGRTADDFDLSLSDSNGRLIISNHARNRKKEYDRDDNGAWVLRFATDLKMGEI